MPEPRTLVIFHKQLGDLLLLESAIALLARRSGAPVGVLTRSGHEDLVRLMPSTVWMPNPGRARFDDLWAFEKGRKTALRAVLIRARRKHMRLHPDAKPEWYHHVFFRGFRVDTRGSEYVARYYWKMVDPDPDEPFDRPRLLEPPDDWAVPAGTPTEYILANVSAGWRSKQWRGSAWSDAINEVANAAGLPVVVTSGGDGWQTEHAERVVSKLTVPFLNLGGKTSLREFLMLVRRARLVMTIDGLAGHVATAYDVPCVTIFAGRSVDNWHIETPTSKAVVAADLLSNPEAVLKVLPGTAVSTVAVPLLRSC